MLGWQVGYLVSQKLEQSNRWADSARVLQKLYDNGETKNPKISFRLGHAHFRLNNLDAAKKHISEAVSQCPENANWNYRLGFIHERLNEWHEALDRYSAAIKTDPSVAEWFYRRAKAYGALQQSNEATNDLLKSNKLAPNVERYRSALSEKIQTQGPLWQKIRTLEDGLFSNQDNSIWHHQMGTIYHDMNRFQEAVESFSAACVIQPGSSLWQYQLGLSLEKANRNTEANDAYSNAIALDTKINSARFGIGAFHERRRDWKMAQEAYQSTLSIRPTDQGLCFKLARAYQKVYNWTEAEKYLRQAITLHPSIPEWHYQLGFTLERQNLYAQAESAYTYAIRASNEIRPEWYYRLGTVRWALGKFEQACESFERFHQAPAVELTQEDVASLEITDSDRDYVDSILTGNVGIPLNRRTPTQLSALALLAEQNEDHEFSIKAYESITRTSKNQDSIHWHNLGRALAMAGRYEESSLAYREMLEIKTPHGQNLEKYFKNKTIRTLMTYSELLNDLSIEPESVLFESNHGSTIGCNPYSIYQAVANDPSFDEYTFIWVLNDPSLAPEDIRNDHRVILTPRNGQLYNRYLASAKYLVNNNTFPPYFTRRPEQRYLNTWHGTPIKTLGKDIPSSFLEHKNATRNFLQVTDFIMPNQHTIDILLDRYDVKDVTSARVGLTGYPRNDRSINISDAERSAILARMGLDPEKKTVLYAPTWRGSLGKAKFDSRKLVDDLEFLNSNDYQLIFRGHQNTENILKGISLNTTVVPTDIDTNSLLGAIDVLITDYSSIFFDILSIKKPIIFYAYDLAEYEAERGLYIDLDELPGVLCLKIEDVRRSLEDQKSLTGSINGGYLESIETFAPLDDGQATRRAVKFFFGNDDAHLIDSNKHSPKKTLLFYQGSFIPNGIMIAFLNLLTVLDESEYNICIVVDPDQISKFPERLEQFMRLPKHVKVFAKVGGHPLTPEEREVTNSLWDHHRLDSNEQWKIVKRAFQREFDHTFGAGTEFHTIINYEGYVRYWEALFAFGGNPERRIGYLHSDMNKEWTERFAHLECLFHTYSEFDALISVGESSYEENTKQLAKRFNINESSFTYVNNPLDLERIVQGAKEPIDTEMAVWCDNSDQLFVAVGRLSPEKDHAKLLRSFANVLAHHHKSRLVIVGDGNLRADLVRLSIELNISESVMFTGSLINPYPIIARADCFVFPSNYEGQGLAILEALILGRPVVSTDITGARGLLRNGHGLLVENSIEGLTDGMLAHFSGDIPQAHFDSEAYQTQSRLDFLTNVIGLK